MNVKGYKGWHLNWGKIARNVAIFAAIPFAIFVVFKLLILIKLALDWYLAPADKSLTMTERKDLIQGLASVIQALAVAGGLIGIYLTWRNSERQVRVAREGQITERFTRAIEQLGATDDKGQKLEIRLGGIYSLERIARDSPERDYSTVIEVLAAYVRENASFASKKDANRKQENNIGFKSEEASGQSSKAPPKVPADIQAILDVLKRLKQLEEKGLVPEEQRVEIDLRRSNLSQANLFGANLSGAIGLTQDQLERAEGDTTTKLPEGLEWPKSWPEPP